MTLDDHIFKDVFFGPNSSFHSPLTPLTSKMVSHMHDTTMSLYTHTHANPPLYHREFNFQFKSHRQSHKNLAKPFHLKHDIICY